MALIKCPECGQLISDKAKACIHCGYPLDYEDDYDDDDYDEDYQIQLRTYQTPFVIDQYSNDGSLSGRYAITDISFDVEDGELRIYVLGRKIYQAPDVIWSLAQINWKLVSPDRCSTDGTEYLGRLSQGESFSFEISEFIYESGTYILTMDAD